MVGERIPGPGGRNRSGKRRKKRRARGLEVVERDGFWHVHGTVTVTGLDGKGRSCRIRKGTGLPAIADTRPAAETQRDTWALEFRNQILHGVQPSCPLPLAIEKYLHRRRKAGRKPGWREVKLMQDIARAFPMRLVNEVEASEWVAFGDKQTEGSAASTRERFLNGLFSFLNWCAAPPRRWLTEKTMPHFERDQAARKPRHRQRRHVAGWRPELIQLLVDNAGWHLKPQLWVEWSTGQRATAILKPRLKDAVLAPGREQITFPTTKTGEPVTASLHPAAGEALRGYLKKRGRLWDREGPLFLTRAGKPYKTENGLSGHNRKAFNNAKARSVAARRRMGLHGALELRAQGRVEEAREAIGQAWADMKLMRQITQHWFRHLLATTILAMGESVRVGMDQGGWLTLESFMAYAHDVPEVRRAVVDKLPLPKPKTESA